MRIISFFALIFIGIWFTFWEEEKLIFATSSDYPPKVYINQDGEIVGKEVEIVKALCDKLNLQYKIVDASFENLIPGLISRRYDVVFGGIVKTSARAEIINFTEPIYSDEVVLASKNITHLTMLKDKTIGYQAGSVFENEVQRLKDEYFIAHVKIYVDALSMMEALRKNYIDAIVIDKSALRDKYEMIVLSKNDIALGLRKENSDLLRLLNSVIEKKE